MTSKLHLVSDRGAAVGEPVADGHPARAARRTALAVATADTGGEGGAAAAVAPIPFAAPRRSLRRDERGAVTAEYAIVIMAAVAFAGLLVAIMRSSEIRAMLVQLVENALGAAG